MPEKVETTHTLMQNELVIYRRERSGIWQCRFKVADVWQRASTKHRDLKLANQLHAALIRDLINQNATAKRTDYCVRVTANPLFLLHWLFRGSTADAQDQATSSPMSKSWATFVKTDDPKVSGLLAWLYPASLTCHRDQLR